MFGEKNVECFKKLSLAGAFLLLSSVFVNNTYAVSDAVLIYEGTVTGNCETSLEAMYLSANPEGKPSKFDRLKGAAKKLVGKSKVPITNEMFNAAQGIYNASLEKYVSAKKTKSDTELMSQLDTMASQCKIFAAPLG
ncbi:MAG: hypothetical protein Q8L85_07285 [Alphaproteobacteria bacterium]|nr:hypothetical protein [Alphaproteobacteria bacterium]